MDASPDVSSVFRSVVGQREISDEIKAGLEEFVLIFIAKIDHQM